MGLLTRSTYESPVPRPEYPRPDLVRKDWVNLNGEWEFAFDDKSRGVRERWFEPERGDFPLRIQVPFAYQAPASGIGDPSFHDIVWYRRLVRLPASWRGQRILLHFGAVNYAARVWLNGRLAAEHIGGYTPFYVDVTDTLGSNVEWVTIVVQAVFPSRAQDFPRGKQRWTLRPKAGFHTPTTGIWQTVWMEPVPPMAHVHRVRLRTEPGGQRLHVRIMVGGSSGTDEARVTGEVEVRYEGRVVGVASGTVGITEMQTEIRFQPEDVHLWSPEEPHLYQLTYRLFCNGEQVDVAEGYTGLRWVSVEKGRICLNGKPYYMKLVLDQGYWSEGLLTAPSDEALKADIEWAKRFGFNGCIKYQKAEDPRFFYWADRLGYLVWSGMANAHRFSRSAIDLLLKEWQEIVLFRDTNHPCIVAWVPISESFGFDKLTSDSKQVDRQIALTDLLRVFDPTRLVVSNDGWEHSRSDVLSIHDYDDAATLARRYQTLEGILAHKPEGHDLFVLRGRYMGQPVVVSRYGGICAEGEELARQYRALTEALFSSPVVQGICYAQLTDVEDETTGLLTYDRRPKVDSEQIKVVNDAKPSRS